MVTPFVPARPGRSPAASAPGAEGFEVEAEGPAALGALAPHATDPAVTDLLLDGAGSLWRDAGAGLERVREAPPLGPAEARRLAVALVAGGDRHIDDANPVI